MIGGVSDLMRRIVMHACGFSHSVRVLAKPETELLGAGFDLPPKLSLPFFLVGE